MERREDQRVSRGPAEPDGGVPENARVPLASERGVGGGGRGVIAQEGLEGLPQQPGLDVPYGTVQTGAAEASGATARKAGEPTEAEPADDTPGTVGSAQARRPAR